MKPNRKLCMLLYVAGERVQAEIESFVVKRGRALGLPVRFPRFPTYLIATTPGLCLKEKCRNVIRKHLLELDPHENLFIRVPRLGLPSLLTEYLLYGF